MLHRPTSMLTQLTQAFKSCVLQERTIHTISKQLPNVATRNNCKDRLAITSSCCREKSDFKSDREFETPSPYKGTDIQHRFKYNWEYYEGGILPRPDSHKDIPLKSLPKWNPREKDQWTQKKALFGQNDYIDILGDGSVHPKDLLKGPAWVKGFKGNELQRIVRQFAFQGQYLREHRPKKYHDLSKQLFYLYKRFNRRKRSSHWGRKGHSAVSRTDKYNKSWTY